MNLGNELVSAILREKKLKPVLDAGFTAQWLNDPEGGSEAVFDGVDFAAFRSILDHYAKHHKVPDLELFLSNFPAYKRSKRDISVTETVELAIEWVRDNLVNRVLSDAVDLQDKGKIDAVAALLETGAKRLSRHRESEGNREYLGEDLDGLTGYDRVLARMDVEAIPTGIPGYDVPIYLGALTAYLGRQKAGKTTLMADAVLSAIENNYSALVFSTELDANFMQDKIYGIAAGINPGKIERKELSASEIRRYNEADERFRLNRKEGIDLIIDPTKNLTLPKIREAIEAERPHFVFIDGYNFIKDDRPGSERDTPFTNWRTDDYMADELAAMAAETECGIVVTTQVREKGYEQKKGITAASMSGGTALVRACTLLLTVDKVPFSPGQHLIGTEANRKSGEYPTVMVSRDWSTMELEELDATTFAESDIDI